jgi:hypothetical protein
MVNGRLHGEQAVAEVMPGREHAAVPAIAFQCCSNFGQFEKTYSFQKIRIAIVSNKGENITVERTRPSRVPASV